VDTILREGQLVDGKYRVEHLIGEGGMAAVWAGTNERTGKRVALKVILRSLATTPVAQSLFQSEALASSRVNHPNVVTVFDVIEHEGMACIVMELLEGEPLGSYIARKGFLSVHEAAELLLPAMRGVAAAHAQGVIHRDLKPQNIFVCIGPDGRMVTSKVLDFGISVMVERTMDHPSGAPSGLAMGTPAYMSPEHILGVAHIDERADVYGFGVLLYEALTGQTPFPGEPGPALFERILNEPAPSVTLFRPDLPPGWVRIIEKAMAKKADDRYSDLNRMVGALEDELAPPTPLPRLLTPPPGAPSFASRDSVDGPSGAAVQAILRKEPSGQHKGTQLYFALPAEGQSQEGAPSGAEGARPPRPTNRDGSPVEQTTQFLRVPVSGLRSLPGQRGLVALGLAVAIAFAVGIAMRGASKIQTAAPGLLAPPALDVAEPAPRPAAPAVVSVMTIPSVTVPAAPPASPSPPKILATPSHSTRAGHARVMPAKVVHVRSRVATREPPKYVPPPRKLVRGYLPEDDLSATEGAGASVTTAAPRAGGLSVDDF
jgi:serine/threonine-protein kinase